MAMQLSVKLLTGEMHAVEVTGALTVSALKVQLAQKMGVPPYQQKLACHNGAHMELCDGSRLADYQLKSGDMLMLMVKNEEAITIFVKSDRGRTSTYSVLPSEGVTSFKARVQQQESIQAEQFWLSFEGKVLEDGHKLGDYNIAPHCTIYLHLRLRGGGRCFGCSDQPSCALPLHLGRFSVPNNVAQNGLLAVTTLVLAGGGGWGPDPGTTHSSPLSMHASRAVGRGECPTGPGCVLPTSGYAQRLSSSWGHGGTRLLTKWWEPLL
ncbi:ubiquitin-like protein ISG15 [Carettochelys insculpta]|uniref:ubiquitin-like protein ISG15 n=1 Tax=Carettochelys insculpta TaxID=44489 RepID=UPI003EBCE3B6